MLLLPRSISKVRELEMGISLALAHPWVETYAQALDAETQQRGVSLLLCRGQSGARHRAGHVQRFARCCSQTMKTISLILLLILVALPGRALDSNEIATTVQVHSNRIELKMEMAFSTAMRMAGWTPSPEIAAATQFEQAQPALRNLAGMFFDFTAGNHRLTATRTNAQLGMENHIHLELEFAPTPHRPLRLMPQGLLVAGPEHPYGVTLTVQDMVNQKVLGQTTLFMANAAAEFPLNAAEESAAVATETETDQSKVTHDAEEVPVAAITNTAALPAPQPQPGLAQQAPFILILLVAVLALVLWIRRRD
jgi:hypothetical protein